MRITPRRAWIALAAGLAILALAALGLWQFGWPLVSAPPTSTPPPSPTPWLAPAEFTPPPSLEELAAEYPLLAPLLSDPDLASAYKEFVVAYESGGIEAARDLAYRRGLLDEQDRLRFTLELDTNDPAVVDALRAELTATGAQALGARENLMDVAIPLPVIEAAAAQQNPAAIFERITGREHIVRIRLPVPPQPQGDPVPGEGVQVTGAGLWHQNGLTGQGIKVGIIDLGFNNYDGLLGGELPDASRVVARSFAPGVRPQDTASRHGTAVAEVIHEMAPDAELYLAYYDGGDVSFGNAVEWLVSQNVQIISNSTGWTVGPMDGSDERAALVDSVAAQGILWINSAGNSAGLHYRGTFTDADGDGWHEFPDGGKAIGLATGPDGLWLALNWDDWDQAWENFDLYVFDQNGAPVAASEDAQTGRAGQSPVEIVFDRSVPADTVLYAAIFAKGATRPVTFDLYVEGIVIEFPAPDHSLISPADARGALAVAAVDWADGELAFYSSRGPANDGRLKPELAAPSHVQTASYAPEVFGGTSAAAPHVSGAAALVWSANPDWTADQVRQYLLDNVIDLPPDGVDNDSGYGAIRLPPPPSMPAPAITAAAATEAALVSTAQPAPIAAAGDEAVASALAMTALCGSLLLCGLGLMVAGGLALLLGRGRRPTSTTPPPQAATPPHYPNSIPFAPPSARGVDAAETAAEEETALDVAPLHARLEAIDGRAYELLAPGVTLGRGSECNIVLANNQVSRRHAAIRLESMGWAITDLHSSNGTFVNGVRLKPNTPHRLTSGDRIALGGTSGVKLTFVIA